MWRRVFCENFTFASWSHDFCAVPWDRTWFRRLCVMRYATLLSWILQYCNSTVIATISRLFAGVTFKLMVHESTFITRSASRWFLATLTSGWMPKIAQRLRALTLEIVSARPSLWLPKVDSDPLELFLIEHVSPSFRGSGEGLDFCVNFPLLFPSWRKLQLSPLEHCPFAFHW